GVLTAVASFLIILTFSITVVMNQKYLPSRLSLASDMNLNLAISVDGIAAAAMGVVADAYGLRTVMWLIVVLAMPMIALARTLPVTNAERRAATTAAQATRSASKRPAPATGSTNPRPSS